MTISTLSRRRTNSPAFLVIIILLFAVIFSAPVKAEEAKDSSLRNMDSPFGVLEFLHWNHPWNNYKYSCPADLEKAVGLMKEAGVAWVRVDFLWEDIEPAQGQFEFAKYDAIVELLARNDINILGLLDYTASWASPCGKWNYPPADNSLFVNYAVKTAERYKDKVRYWEIWNEPDSSVYWANQDGLKSYCVLLKDAYTALKKLSPEFKILNGGLANGISSVNYLYDNGAGTYFDILNLHVFESPFNLGAAKRLSAYPRLAYKIMSRNGDAGKKIWITEIGSPGVKRGLKAKNWWLGKNPNERQQAKWLQEVFTRLAGEEHVEKVFWAFFRDCKGHWDTGVDYFGIIRWDFSRKPAFSAYQKCVNKWKNSR